MALVNGLSGWQNGGEQTKTKKNIWSAWATEISNNDENYV